MAEGVEGGAPQNDRDKKMMGSNSKANEEIAYDLDKAVENTSWLRGFFRRRANKELKALDEEEIGELTFREKRKNKKAEKRAKKEERKKPKVIKKEYSPVAEAEKILEEDGSDPVAEAEMILAAENKAREKKAEPYNRPPEPFDLPTEPIIDNLENVLEGVLSKWGSNPDEIKNNVEKADIKDVFDSIWRLTNAEIEDKGKQAEKLGEMDIAKELKAQVDTAYQALTTPNDPNIRTESDTGIRLVDVTPGDKDGKPTAKAGREAGKLYNTFNEIRTANAKMFLGIFENEIRCLVNAGKAAKTIADGKPLEYNYKENPEIDANIEPLNDYLRSMLDSATTAKTVFNDPGNNDALLRVAIKMAKKQQPESTDEEAEELARQTITDAPKSLENILAFYESVNEKNTKLRKSRGSKSQPELAVTA